MTYELANDMETRIKVQEIVKSKYPEFSTLAANHLLRISFRLTHLRQSGFKAMLTSEISKYVFDSIANEKLSTKAKAFAYWSKLSHDLLLTDYTFKLQNLLKDIRSQIENYDQVVILNLLSGLTYFDDSNMGNEALKEICDILTMTIKHRVDSIRHDFVMKVISYINDIEQERAVKVEHLETWIDYLTSNVPSERGFFSLPIFRLIRKHRYEDKARIEKLYNVLAEKQNVVKIHADENTEAFRSSVRFTLGESAIENLHNSIIEELKSRQDTLNTNARVSVHNLTKALMFTQTTNETSDKIHEGLINIINSLEVELSRLRPLLVEVAKNSQHLRSYRESITDAILKKLTSNIDKINAWGPSQKINLILFTMELPLITAEQNNQFKTLRSAVLNDVALQSRFVNIVANELPSGKINFNKNFMHRLVNTIREFTTNKEFIDAYSKKLLSSLILINYYYTVQNRRTDQGNNNDFIRLADSLKENNPDLKVMQPGGKLLRLVKHFDMLNIESKALNSELVYLLKQGINSPNDLVLALSKLIRMNIPEKQELFEKYINDQNIHEKFSSIKNISAMCRFYILITDANKEKLISDERTKELQREMVKIVKLQDEKPHLRIEAACAMTNARVDVLRDIDVKELGFTLKDIFAEIQSVRKVTRYFDQLYSRNELVTTLLSNISGVYLKEQGIDKNSFIRILDLFTKNKWRSTNFYNKIISDYEELFEKCNSNDHATVVTCLARIGLKKDDVLKAAVKNIKLNLIDSRKKINLFNDLALLGCNDQEWKDLILDKLVADGEVSGRNPSFIQLKTLVSLWALGDWPKNKDEIVKSIIASLDRSNLSILRNRFMRQDDSVILIGSLKHSPFYNQFGEETKKLVIIRLT
jgi:hypothetical protein